MDKKQLSELMKDGKKAKKELTEDEKENLKLLLEINLMEQKRLNIEILVIQYLLSETDELEETICELLK